MPAKIHPRDWERLFRKGAPRRGGPLHILANILFFTVALGILSGGVVFAWRYAQDQLQISYEKKVADATASAEHFVATRTARTATAQAKTTVNPSPAITGVTPSGALGIGRIESSGNLRREPLISPETVLGQVCVGDNIAFLEERVMASTVWYRIRVVTVSANCADNRATSGTEGWVSAQLVSAPTPKTQE